MADAKQCDRCGKFYTRSSECGCEFYSKIENRKRVINEIGNSHTSFDVCSNCWDDFKKWWESGYEQT